MTGQHKNKRRLAIEQAIREDPFAPSSSLAKRFGVSRQRVLEVSAKMPLADRLRRKPGGQPISRELKLAIRAALADNHQRASTVIACGLGCSTIAVRKVRRAIGLPSHVGRPVKGYTRLLIESMIREKPLVHGRLKEIADVLGVSRGYVYQVWWRMKSYSAPDLRKAKRVRS